MIESYKNKLRAALLDRKNMELPGIRVIIACSTAFVLAYIVFAILDAPRGKPLEHHFTSERGWVTVLSALLLSMASAFSISSLATILRTGDRRIALFVVMAFGFAFLALDELMQFHERLGAVIGSHHTSSIFRNWNDIIVILYGVLALPILAVFLPSIMRYRMFLELLGTAFLFYAIHTLIDSTQEPRTTVSAICEESAKLLCVLYLALSVFSVFWGTLWSDAPSMTRKGRLDNPEGC